MIGAMSLLVMGIAIGFLFGGVALYTTVVRHPWCPTCGMPHGTCACEP